MKKSEPYLDPHLQIIPQLDKLFFQFEAVWFEWQRIVDHF